MRLFPAFALLGLLVTAVGPSAAAPVATGTPYAVSAETDWGGRRILLRIELGLRGAGLKMPAARLEAERMVERDLPGIVKDAVFSLPVDSYRTVGDTVLDGSLDINALLGLAFSSHRLEAFFTRDQETFVARYELPLLAASSLYVRHSAATPLPSSMIYRPTKAYTGIVIYARGELAVRGEGKTAPLQPCLFPRLFDSEMNLLLDRNTASPEALRAWGPVGYVRELGAFDEDRVGDSPLRIVAEAVFGSNRTDLVLSRDEALKILGLEENRALIAQGRVIIVYDPH